MLIPGHSRASISRVNAGLTFEVITRRLEDRGGGLASVDGRPRLLEGLAMPREEDEFELLLLQLDDDLDRSSMFCSTLFGLTRDDILAITNRKKSPKLFAGLLPGFPPTSLSRKREKALGPRPGRCFSGHPIRKALGRPHPRYRRSTSKFIVVPRLRGQQLKDPAQLDAWLRDGSAAYIDSLCEWS